MLGGKHLLRGPKRQKRPADVIANAVHVMPFVTEEIEEARSEDGKSAAAVALGRKGGVARAKATSNADRTRIARAGAKARWNR